MKDTKDFTLEYYKKEEALLEKALSFTEASFVRLGDDRNYDYITIPSYYIRDALSSNLTFVRDQIEGIEAGETMLDIRSGYIYTDLSCDAKEKARKEFKENSIWKDALMEYFKDDVAVEEDTMDKIDVYLVANAEGCTKSDTYYFYENGLLDKLYPL